MSASNQHNATVLLCKVDVYLQLLLLQRMPGKGVRLDVTEWYVREFAFGQCL